MAYVACIRNFQAGGFAWRDKPERVTTDVHISDFLLDFWHVAAYALIASGSGSVMRVRLNTCRVRSRSASLARGIQDT